VIDTVLPGGAHPELPGAFDAGFPGFWEEFEATAPRRLRLGFRVGVLAATWVAPVLIGRPPPLGLYGRATRERALVAMASSRSPVLRSLLGIVKLVAALGYGAAPEVRRAIGYGGARP